MFLVSLLPVFGLFYLCEVTFKFKLNFFLNGNSYFLFEQRYHASFNIQSSYFLSVYRQKVVSFYNETLRGVRVIRAFGKQETLETKFQDLLDELLAKIHIKIAANR